MNPRPLYECECHFMQSEALPILPSSSRKDESNAVFSVSICLPVWFLEAISSSCMTRANVTCHVQFCEHPDIDKNMFPSFARVEHRRSGPNQISRSATKSIFVRSGATCHRHVPRGTRHIAIGQIALLLSVRATQNLSSPYPFSRSSTRSNRVKTLVTCQWHKAR